VTTKGPGSTRSPGPSDVLERPRCRGRPLQGPAASVRAVGGRERSFCYSHSMVPGGLLVTSRVTRLTSGTSLVIRVEIFASTS
jgi:hypothetical protein